MTKSNRRSAVLGGLVLLACLTAAAQVDPMRRNLLELGYDQAIGSQGPQAVYLYYHYNDPQFMRTNMALRMAIAPAYVDGELGFKRLLSPTTDVGIGIYGGAFGDNYYEVRQGDYIKSESFDGLGGGTALSIYQSLNPGMLIPLNMVARVGFRYSTYIDGRDTADNFVLPPDRFTGFVRTGLRFAGKEPMLYPDLGLEVSVWYERQWRTAADEPYGLNGDRQVNAACSLYWAFAGLNYAWTNIGHKFSFAVTAGGSTSADNFSAWRIGGVLPLVAEFPLVLPGYYYQELTAESFVHFYGSYVIPLERTHRLQLMLESASARLSYLPGYAQTQAWQTGAGVGLSYTSKREIYRVVLRYGYGFNAIRDGHQGANSIGLLFQYNFEARKQSKRG